MLRNDGVFEFYLRYLCEDAKVAFDEGAMAIKKQ